MGTVEQHNCGMSWNNMIILHPSANLYLHNAQSYIMCMHLYTTCTLLAHYLHTTCTLLAYYLHTTCTLLAYYLHTTCILLVYYLLAEDTPEPVHHSTKFTPTKQGQASLEERL